MIISVNWLKKYVDIDLPIDELVSLIGERLVEVESVKYIGDKYADCIVARVVTAEPVPDSDHLSLVTIDDGGRQESVDRLPEGTIQVVCGAPNVRSGMLVVWLPPGAIVPSTRGTDKEFRLEARPLRGHVSNGMLASARELDLYDEHEGILELNLDAEAGANFVDVAELDDYLLDIENKSLTHRPDTFGVIGFAREIAGILGQPFHSPSWLTSTSPVDDNFVFEPVEINIADPELSNRFSAVILQTTDHPASTPLDIQLYLARSGVRPISPIVDVTNYLMLLTGQPLHAYDYDKFLKVAGDIPVIGVRRGREAEKLTLIDGKERSLANEDIVITANDRPIGLAGAMGGSETEVDQSTRRVLLECATFDLYSLRGTQMRHGIFSEAITRLTKGVPAELGKYVINEAIRLLGSVAGLEQVSRISSSYPVIQSPEQVEVSASAINDILGTDFSNDDIVKTLSSVEFKVSDDGSNLRAAVPYWRNDVHRLEDVAEEMGRLNGYDNIRPTLPERPYVAVRTSKFDSLRREVRRWLVSAGANEVLTYSFIHGEMMKRAKLDPADSYRLVNSLSPELQYYRQSIVPSLLAAVHPNIKAGYDKFALFELNKTHAKSIGNDRDGVPLESSRLGFVTVDAKSDEAAPYYQAKQYADFIFDKLGVTVEYRNLSSQADTAMARPFEPKRAAEVWLVEPMVLIGIVGEIKSDVLAKFKLPKTLAAFELNTEVLFSVVEGKSVDYKTSSRFPEIERDVCFQTGYDVEHQSIVAAIKQSLSDSEYDITESIVDIYSPSDRSHKNTTFRFVIVSHERTLTNEEVNQYMNGLTDRVCQSINGRVV